MENETDTQPHPPTPISDVVEEKLRAESENIQKLMELEEEDLPVEYIICSLRNSLMGVHSGDKTDLGVILTSQSHLLHAAFNHFLKQAHEKPENAEHYIDRALQAQLQTQRAIMTWRYLNSGTNK
jgi:hypothetical protein